MSLLRDELNRIVQIPPEEWDYFAPMINLLTVPRDDHFIRAGDSANLVGFCTGGLFRLYYTTPEGAEFNKSFCVKSDFVTSYSALLQNETSHLSIQALVESELFTFKFEDFRTLYDRHPCWERVGRVLAEKLFVLKETRERELLLLSAEQRYLLFLERFDKLSGQIPLYHVASYLGITPVALSRIRRRLT
ncbi:Crp/Fnr family transcriptional regulator [Paenibacillus sp. YPG26]|uniref:Crp/Fnr family transcriptional regulator n=1 Tax=Paenibacillus sp. YPG26 TaxID=2878915 RepID=UPI00203E8F0A|nr:Crp/Fnr family transcriptional regulator [Paenibacillus sp. YPG26]USB32321.1 Crp/Fnr family transcriptional regulator [Paenibacillus sp. YPG26]